MAINISTIVPLNRLESAKSSEKLTVLLMLVNRLAISFSLDTGISHSYDNDALS
jgi:hypothetical protein